MLLYISVSLVTKLARSRCREDIVLLEQQVPLEDVLYLLERWAYPTFILLCLFLLLHRHILLDIVVIIVNVLHLEFLEAPRLEAYAWGVSSWLRELAQDVLGRDGLRFLLLLLLL